MIENFKYWLINTKIFEQAFRLRDARFKISEKAYTLNFHLMKCYFLKNESYFNHWKDEVLGYLKSINRITIKPFNKKFDKDEYIEWLFIEPLCDGFSSFKKSIYKIEDKEYTIFINDIKDQYNIIIKLENEDKLDFEKKIVQFYLDVCDILSKKDNEDYFNDYIEKKFNNFVL